MGDMADIARERVLRYLYKDMAGEERSAFENELESSNSLRTKLREEEKFQRVYPPGTVPDISDETIGESQLLLRHELRRLENRKGPISRLLSIIQSKMASPVGLSLAFVTVFMLGFTVNKAWLPSGVEEPGIGRAVASVEIPDPGALDILDLQVTDYNPSTGDLNLRLDAVSRFTYRDNIRNESAQTLFAAALQSNLEPGARLETIELLRSQTSSGKIRQVLIQVLLHDENPGVRLQALDVLKDLAYDTQVRQALLLALSRDHFPGVRVGAIEALRSYCDQKEIAMVNVDASTEDRNFIEDETRRTLGNWNSILQE
jgi:hypothetical protein